MLSQLASGKPTDRCRSTLRRVEKGADVYINTVGTFGVASASYYWSRVSSALGRLSQYLAGDGAYTWRVVVADDYHLEAGGEHCRSALFAFFLFCCTCGVPLSWNKTASGETVVWIGISQRQAQWFTKWTREVADSDQVHMARFEEGLGRIMFVVEAFELERPFLGPLSIHVAPSWVLSMQSSTLRKILSSLYGRSGLEHQALQLLILSGKHDKQREDGDRGLFPEARTGWQDRCWRVAMVFTRTQRRRLALDLFSGSKTLFLLYGETPRKKHTRVQIVPTITDNRGNSALLNKLMSTKFSASASAVEWAPRDENKEADKLANGNAEDFEPSLRFDVDASTLCWHILPEALEAGCAAERQYQEARERGTLPNLSRKERRRKPEVHLRLKDPW